MGNEHNNNEHHYQDSQQAQDFIANLRQHFDHLPELNTTQPKRFQTVNKKKMKSRRRNLSTCPICFMKVHNYKRLKNCNHLICHNCLNAYIVNDLKNISKYPFSCFQSNCNKLLDFKDIEYALNHDKNQLFIFDKFSILCAISPTEREQCPKCEMVFFYQTKWFRDKTKPFKWIEDSERSKCTNKQCHKQFGIVLRKHHCRICGEIFCDQCSSHLLPLSAASDAMVKTWIQSHNPHNNKQNNKVKQWFKSITAISTSDELWSSSDDEDDDIKQEHKEDEQQLLQLSRSEEILIEDEKVRCCYECWLDYYRGVCAECDCIYCIQCRQPWHNGYDCDEIKKEKKAIYLKKKLNEAQTEELMLREGWRRCAGCNVWVAKIEGCNHMTHENCPNPNDVKQCHFCYCCGELLYDPYHKHEKNGTVHFETGVFEACRKSQRAQKIRNKLHDDAKSNIAKIEKEFDDDGLVIQHDTGCVVM